MNKKNSVARQRTPIRLARYKRWFQGERALIYYGRVERYLRSMFVKDEWKELGIANSVKAAPLNMYGGIIFYPDLWGWNGGVRIEGWKYDPLSQRPALCAIGECNLLRFFAGIPELNLSLPSETERSEMFALRELISEREIWLMNFYGQKFKVSRDLNKPYHGEKLAMQPVVVEPWALLEGPAIAFHGKDRALHHFLTRVDTTSGTLLLPATYYASALNPTQFFRMPEMPDSPVLYNSDAIAAHPEATIILSDEIAIPLVNDGDGTCIFSSWYGGLEVIENLDFDLLRGHRILWPCFDEPSAAPVEKFEKALRVAAVCEKHQIGVDFLLFDHTTWEPGFASMAVGSYHGAREISLAELLREGSQYGLNGGRVESERALSMDELLSLPRKDFVVYPVLKEGYYVLIYGGTGVAKTWFALHLAIALTQGRSPFPQWECRSKPMNVLYAAGEMDQSTFGERLKMLLGDQKTNPRFRLIREDLDLTSAEDQAKVDEIISEHQSRVVFLDNLSTLASNGHQEGQFEKIRRFISSLTKRGIIVFLIHHENREGGFKGSGKIELVADQSLHLFATGKGDKIELLVQAEKIRMTARSKQGTFRTEFDPKKPRSVWPVFPLTEEERHRLNEDDPLDEVGSNVGKKRNNQQRAWRYLDDDERAVAIIDDMLTGCLDDVIAANLAVRQMAVAEFKCRNGISEETLRSHLPAAKKKAENDQGNSRPSVLAPIIWEFLKKESHR